MKLCLVPFGARRRRELVLDGPRAANAQTLRMIEELRAGLAELICVDSIGAVVPRGEGE